MPNVLRTASMMIRLTPEEKRAIDATAAKHHLTATSWARSRLMQIAEPVKEVDPGKAERWAKKPKVDATGRPIETPEERSARIQRYIAEVKRCEAAGLPRPPDDWGTRLHS